jgi:hypothetical protein
MNLTHEASPFTAVVIGGDTLHAHLTTWNFVQDLNGDCAKVLISSSVMQTEYANNCATTIMQA